MHGAPMILCNAQQAKINIIYKNTKLKLLKTNSAVLFIRMCRAKQMKPYYIHETSNGKKPRQKRTTKQ